MFLLDIYLYSFFFPPHILLDGSVNRIEDDDEDDVGRK